MSFEKQTCSFGDVIRFNLTTDYHLSSYVVVSIVLHRQTMIEQYCLLYLLYVAKKGNNSVIYSVAVVSRGENREQTKSVAV